MPAPRPGRCRADGSPRRARCRRHRPPPRSWPGRASAGSRSTSSVPAVLVATSRWSISPSSASSISRIVPSAWAAGLTVCVLIRGVRIGDALEELGDELPSRDQRVSARPGPRRRNPHVRTQSAQRPHALVVRPGVDHADQLHPVGNGRPARGRRPCCPSSTRSPSSPP